MASNYFKKPLLSQERAYEVRATERLWLKRMEVFIPRFAVHTQEFIEQRGIPINSSMNEETREKWNKEMVKVRMSINRQIELYRNGIPIAYPNRMKAIEVYKDIKQHVNNWKILLKGSLNNRTKAPPMEDFDLMLEFAENLEKYLEYYYNKLTAQDITPFRRQTMNRFIPNDAYINAENSTYTNLRTELYSVHGKRTERIDDSRRTVVEPDASHYQPIIEFDDSDADEAMAMIRGGS